MTEKSNFLPRSIIQPPHEAGGGQGHQVHLFETNHVFPPSKIKLFSKKIYVHCVEFGLREDPNELIHVLWVDHDDFLLLLHLQTEDRLKVLAPIGRVAGEDF